MNHHLPDEKAEMKRLLVAYALSFIIAGLGLFLVFLMRDLILTLLRNSRVTHWAWTAIDNFALIVTVMVWLVGVFVTHAYFQKGLQSGRGVRRFFFVLGIVLLLYFVVGALPGVLGFGTFTPGIWALIVGAGVAGAGLMVLGRKLPVRDGKR